MSMQKNINFFSVLENIRKDGINDCLLLLLLPSHLSNLIPTHIQVELKMLCLGSHPSKQPIVLMINPLNMANEAPSDLRLCALSATYHPVCFPLHSLL